MSLEQVTLTQWLARVFDADGIERGLNPVYTYGVETPIAVRGLKKEASRRFPGHTQFTVIARPRPYRSKQ